MNLFPPIPHPQKKHLRHLLLEAPQTTSESNTAIGKNENVFSGPLTKAANHDGQNDETQHEAREQNRRGKWPEIQSFQRRNSGNQSEHDRQNEDRHCDEK
jgi:hypothetical protein